MKDVSDQRKPLRARGEVPPLSGKIYPKKATTTAAVSSSTISRGETGVTVMLGTGGKRYRWWRARRRRWRRTHDHLLEKAVTQNEALNVLPFDAPSGAHDEHDHGGPWPAALAAHGKWRL